MISGVIDDQLVAAAQHVHVGRAQDAEAALRERLA